jgi:hypothetical protein
MQPQKAAAKSDTLWLSPRLVERPSLLIGEKQGAPGSFAMKAFRKVPAPHPGGNGDASRRDREDLAAYIVEMTGELARLAGEADLPMLAYFLNLARVEAQITVRERPVRDLCRGA